MRSRLAFVHVPKSAGSSIKNAVSTTLGPGSVAPFRLDRTLFGAFDRFDDMPDRTRSGIARSSDDLAGFDAVLGHVGVSSLAPHFEFADMFTVLREPRTRLLSHYTFWRSWTPERHRDFHPYDASLAAVRLGWEEFLLDPSIASQTDNLVTRMLLGPDERIPLDGFIPADQARALGDEALDRLDSFGFVGVVEAGTELWDGLSHWIGAVVEPERTLVTAPPPDLDWPAELTPDAARALIARTDIDARLWARFAGEDTHAVGEATFHRKVAAVASSPEREPEPPPVPPSAAARLGVVGRRMASGARDVVARRRR